jgi:hypothetical protein
VQENDKHVHRNDQPTLGKSETFFVSTIRRAKENAWTVFGWTIALVFGVYQLVDARVEPDLQVAFDPGAATKIVTTLTPDIEVRYKGSVVAGEVSSQVVRFWNAGKRPIENQDILKQLQIKAPPDITILDARVKQQTRDVVTVVPMAIDKSTVSLTWRILENDDGASIQLIYQGSSDSKFTIEGAVRGQKTIPVNYLTPAKTEPSKLKVAWRKLVEGWSPLANFLATLVLLFVILVVALPLMFALIYFPTRYFSRRFPKLEAPNPGWMLLLVLLMLAGSVARESGYIDSLTTSVPASIR